MKKGLSKKKVLLVDDEKYFLKACKRFLRDGYRVYACSSGKIALDLLKRENDFDVIFLDVSIPDLSGLEIFEHVKRKYPHLSSKIVFVTGGILDEKTQKFLNSVGNRKLEKPFDPLKLIEHIAE